MHAFAFVKDSINLFSDIVQDAFPCMHTVTDGLLCNFATLK